MILKSGVLYFFIKKGGKMTVLKGGISYTKEEEWIRTEVLPYEEASKKFLDGKNLIALFMYERYLESKGRLSRTQMQAP